MTRSTVPRLFAGHAALALCAGAAYAGPITITFDDVPTGSAGMVVNGYQGFNWSGIAFGDHTVTATRRGSGYANGVVSGTHVDYNRFAHMASVSLPGGVFAVHSAHLMAAWNDGLTIEIRGYVGETETHFKSVTVGTAGSSLITFDFVNIDRLTFSSFGGTHAGLSGFGSHFGMDNLVLQEGAMAAIIPLPGAGLVGLAGLMVVGTVRRRRMN